LDCNDDESVTVWIVMSDDESVTVWIVMSDGESVNENVWIVMMMSEWV